MRIIISPAKKMNIDTDSLAWRNLPALLPQTEEILEKLREMDYDALKKLWKCNEKIALQNVERLEHMDLRKQLTPAVLAYEGIQYQYMAPTVFSDKEYDYIQEHLRILSGFYGVLKPFDGVVPYRLEMQAKLQIGDAKDLYAYWGSMLADRLAEETDCIINLASKEYSSAIAKHLPADVRMITCVFGEETGGRIVEKGTLCKMARGEMVRRMAEKHVKTAEDIKEIELANYAYNDELSDDKVYVYTRKDGLF
ncbi:MAG: peroxide stress protein YaaA [Firmicutes bacterium]|nr:peroxide stress protein YaaA [Bacillota bacterium]